MAGQLVSAASMLSAGTYCTLSVLPVASQILIPGTQTFDRIISELSWDVRTPTTITTGGAFIKIQVQGADGTFRDARIPGQSPPFAGAIWQGIWTCDIYGAQLVLSLTLNVAITAFLMARLSIT